MCAIIGIASVEPVNDRDWLAAGRDAMRHRGPDGAGEWWSADDRVGLGHRRLAIIDLSPAGHQPMKRKNTRIVFNGEIYNFQELRKELQDKGATFRSTSDTEVILAAYQHWGTECLGRLKGMFAFALYDGARRQLFLARDRVGEKPLFYAYNGTELRFASELKGLMADPAFPRRLDWDALDCYLAEGFIPGDRCILRGVNKLPAAHALVFDLDTGQKRCWRYWQLPECDGQHTTDPSGEGELLDELDGLLEHAVRRQLVADVPVGVLLSGGVDSSLITAMAARAASTVRTFTVRFPGYGRYDESHHARVVAAHFGTDHVELDAEATTVSLLPLLARQVDEPMVDSSLIPTYLVSGLIREHCTVALGGDGGDELFGGYPHYNRLLWLQSRTRSVPPSIRRLCAHAAERLLPLGLKGRNWLQAAGVDLECSVPMIGGCFDRTSRRLMLCAEYGGAGRTEELREARMPSTADLLQRATRLDFENYLAEDILVKVDRASMLNSMEVRAPMLDVNIIEFAFGKVPSPMKATTTSRKVLLKKLAARVLPPSFDCQRKQGFEIPLASWLRTPAWLGYFREVLLDEGQSLFNRDFIRRLLNYQNRAVVNGERLFGLVMFELWRREYGIEI